jgi:ketosteroid isomerase-like protein
MKNKTILCWLLLALTACAPTETEETGVASGKYGTGEDARQSLMEADRAWSETADDAEAFLTYLAPDVYFLPPDGPRIQGPAAFRSSIDQLLQISGAQLRWSPDVAEVSEGGDLGYTIGSFELTMDGPNGEPITRVGKYVTPWERQEDGSWKVVADIFNFDAPM